MPSVRSRRYPSPNDSKFKPHLEGNGDFPDNTAGLFSTASRGEPQYIESRLRMEMNDEPLLRLEQLTTLRLHDSLLAAEGVLLPVATALEQAAQPYPAVLSP